MDALPLGLENVGVGSCTCICVPSYLCFVYRLHYVLYAFVYICVHIGVHTYTLLWMQKSTPRCVHICMYVMCVPAQLCIYEQMY